jgi:cell division protein FtsQ
MDRRMRARRAEVQRRDRRRRRRRTLSAALLVTILAAAVAVGRSPLFAISEIEVSGVEEALAADVRSAAGVRVGQNLLDADLAAARARIQDLPWVEGATLDQVPPSRVVAAIDPRTAAAVVRTDGESWLIDASGVVFAGGERQGTPVVEAPNLTVPPLGQPVEDEGVRATLAIIGAMPGALADRVLRYRIDDGQVIATLDTDDRLPGQAELDVVLGSAERIAGKASVTLAMIEVVAERQAAADEPEPVTVDVRAPENPVLRR